MAAIESDPSVKWGPRENWRIVKNVVFISLATMMVTTALDGVDNLQSSINAEEAIGTKSLAVMCFTVMVTDLCLAVLVIACLGLKWSIVCASVCNLPFVGLQMYPAFYTLIPAAVLAGFGSSIFWCALCTYIVIVSQAHSRISDVLTETYLARYFGIFHTVFQFNRVLGNFISSAVLSSGENKAAVTSINASEIQELCGANFLPSADAHTVLQPQPPERMQTLVVIYLSFMVCGILLIVFGVDSAKRYKSQCNISENGQDQSRLMRSLETMKLFREPNLLLIILLLTYPGWHNAFMVAEMTVSFISCPIGPGAVGYVMMISGVTGICTSCIVGFTAEFISRIFFMSSVLVLSTALYITILFYRPQPDEMYVIYLFAIVGSICVSVWDLQMKAFLGILFSGREEAAYAAMHLMNGAGSISVLSTSPYFRIRSMVYFLLVLMYAGFTGYFITEYRLSKQNNTFEVTKDNGEIKLSTLDGISCHSKSGRLRMPSHEGKSI